MSLLLDTHVALWAITGDANLEPAFRDPFDRMLVAQATTEGMTLASRDGSIARYDVDLLKV